MENDLKQLATVIHSIADEKNLDEDVVKNILEQAIVAAFRKEFGDSE